MKYYQYRVIHESTSDDFQRVINGLAKEGWLFDVKPQRPIHNQSCWTAIMTKEFDDTPDTGVRCNY